MKLVSAYRVPTAAAVLYELLQERSTEDDQHVNISHRKLPKWSEHLRFMRSKPYRYWYLIEVRFVYVGYISATERNEIGIVLFRRARGQSYGKQALRMFIEKHRPLKEIPSRRRGQWLANINPLNEASIRLFSGAGFGHIQNTYAL